MEGRSRMKPIALKPPKIQKFTRYLRSRTSARDVRGCAGEGVIWGLTGREQCIQENVISMDRTDLKTH